jgi:hypothetical protein
MLIPIAFIIAVLAWLLGRGRFAQAGLLAVRIRHAPVGSIYQQPSLISARYGLSGRPELGYRIELLERRREGVREAPQCARFEL